MKILRVISSVNPEAGGPIEGVKQLSKVAIATGHEVETVSLDSPDAQYLEGFPTKIYALGPAMSGYRYNRRLAPWLRAHASNYDVVVVNGIWQYHGFAVWRVLRGSSIPYVVFTHGMLDPWFKRRYPLKHLKKCLYWPWGEYRVLRDAAAVLFTCEEEMRLARCSFGLYSAKEKVVNYGAAGPIGNVEYQRQQVLTRFPGLKEKRIILFMGRIHPKKGCDLALKAFAAELASDPDWHLVMAGPDQTGWQSQLSELAVNLGIQNRISWTGMVSGDLKWGLINHAEILFLPSHQENFGIVVAEALACRVPVLISNKVNIWREIQADNSGLVAPDTLEGARTLLSSWASFSEQQRTLMREYARNSFVNRFEIGKANSSLIATLQEVIAENERLVQSDTFARAKSA